MHKLPQTRVREISHRWALVTAVIAVFTLSGCGGDTTTTATDSATAERDAQAFVEALKPRDADRPIIAIVARNEGTEITDFLLAHAVLQRSGVADVQAVASRRGRVTLYPAPFQVEVTQDLAGFDQLNPTGADYVIVPAMSDDNDPIITAWLKQQADRGARIIGVCVGALVVGNAGLLDGRRFVTHWNSRDELIESHPTALYVPDQRYVIDGNIATTTGVTASVPAMLALVESIGGREKARALATELGVDSWTPAHESWRFGLDAKRATNFLLNKAAFWRDEEWIVDVKDGMDDVSLAFAVDAWSRTWHIDVEASAPAPVKLRSGLVLVAQPATEDKPRLPLEASLKPMQQLDRTLCQIGERFSTARREWVMLELEYPATGDVCTRG